ARGAGRGVASRAADRGGRVNLPARRRHARDELVTFRCWRVVIGFEKRGGMHNALSIAAYGCAVLVAAAPAVAQQATANSNYFADNQERIAENHYRYTGHFELQQGETTL